MRIIMVLVLLTPLGGCMVTDRYVADEVVAEEVAVDRALDGRLGRLLASRRAEFYTRSEIDALNAENQCRLLARNLVQIYRCGVRR